MDACQYVSCTASLIACSWTRIILTICRSDCLVLFDYLQSVLRPDISCPTGTARSFQRAVSTLFWMITWNMTRCCVLEDRFPGSRKRSMRLPIGTAGDISCLCRMTITRVFVGSERSLSGRSLVKTQTTRLPGSDLVLNQRKTNFTTFWSRYEHSREVSDYYAINS